MTKLKEVTMIFKGKPSEESFRKFVTIIEEIRKENELKELNR